MRPDERTPVNLPPNEIDDIIWITELLLTGDARRIREAAGLSRLQFVILTGFSDDKTLARYESNQQSPRPAQAVRYAESLRMIVEPMRSEPPLKEVRQSLRDGAKRRLAYI